jgi:hypothetical protein
MFTSGQSEFATMVFSALTLLVAIPSGVKVFNWTATLYKGSIWLTTPMLYALSFLVQFTIGGLTGLFLGTLADRHPPARHLLRRGPLPLRDDGRHRDRLPRRPALLVAQDHRQDVRREARRRCPGPSSSWASTPPFSCSSSWARAACPGATTTTSRVPPLPRVLHRGLVDPRRRLPHLRLRSSSRSAREKAAPPTPGAPPASSGRLRVSPRPRQLPKTPEITRGPYDYHLATEEELFDGFPEDARSPTDPTRLAEPRLRSRTSAHEHRYPQQRTRRRRGHGHHDPFLAHHFDTPRSSSTPPSSACGSSSAPRSSCSAASSSPTPCCATGDGDVPRRPRALNWKMGAVNTVVLLFQLAHRRAGGAQSQVGDRKGTTRYSSSPPLRLHLPRHQVLRVLREVRARPAAGAVLHPGSHLHQTQPLTVHGAPHRGHMFFALYFMMTGLHGLHVSSAWASSSGSSCATSAGTSPRSHFTAGRDRRPLLAPRRPRLDLPLPPPLPGGLMSTSTRLTTRARTTTVTPTTTAPSTRTSPTEVHGRDLRRAHLPHGVHRRRVARRPRARPTPSWRSSSPP